MPLREYGDRREQEEFLEKMLLAETFTRADVDRLIWIANHWMVNTTHIRKRCELLTQRPDLPVDRIPAFRYLQHYQEQNQVLRECLHAANEERKNGRR